MPNSSAREAKTAATGQEAKRAPRSPDAGPLSTDQINLTDEEGSGAQHARGVMAGLAAVSSNLQRASCVLRAVSGGALVLFQPRTTAQL